MSININTNIFGVLDLVLELLPPVSTGGGSPLCRGRGMPGTSSFAAWPAQGPSGSEGPGSRGAGLGRNGVITGGHVVVSPRTVGNTWVVLLGTVVGQCRRWSPVTQPGASPTHPSGWR